MSAERKKLILAIAVIFAANIFIIALVQYASADLYKRGASGDTVREIQTRLKNWGYYSGAVDGVYGSGTEEAVRLFQRKNGLSVDGQVGDQTLAALGISPSSSGGSGSQTASDSDLYLLARVISAEARGEPYNGQVAVGAVILNRIKHPSFPNTLSGVIYQTDAYSANLTVVDTATAEMCGQVIYPAAVLNVTAHEQAARDFLTYLTSPEAGEIFAAVGFTPLQ